MRYESTTLESRLDSMIKDQSYGLSPEEFDNIHISKYQLDSFVYREIYGIDLSDIKPDSFSEEVVSTLLLNFSHYIEAIELSRNPGISICPNLREVAYTLFEKTYYDINLWLNNKIEERKLEMIDVLKENRKLSEELRNEKR